MEYNELERWKPGVQKAVLLLIAGSIWILIGIMMDFYSYNWLKNEQLFCAFISAVAGLVTAMIIHRFGFSRIVNKNLKRIIPMQGKRCLFSFIPWKSYILICIMIFLGSFLRHSSIPKTYLSVLYIGIGTAMILSGFMYIRIFIRLITNRHSNHL